MSDMLGHNNPPEVTELMAIEQREAYSDKLSEIDRIIKKEETVPKEVNDDESAGAAGDFIKLAKAVIKEADAIRLAERKKYTVKSDAIQNFWKKKLAPLEEKVAEVDSRLAVFLKKKEDEKRRAAEEKAQRDKEEADRKLKEAQEKERIAQEAREAAEAEAKRVAEAAEAAKKAAEEEAARVKAEADAEAKRIADEAAAKLKAAQDEIDRLNEEKRLADEAAAQKILQDEADRAAEEKRKAEEKAAQDRLKEAAKEVKAADKQVAAIHREAAAEIKEINKEAREEIKAAEETLSAVNKEVKEATRDLNRSLDEAVRADRVAMKSEKQTLAGVAAFSRTRGDGSVASLSETWKGGVADRDELFESAREIWDHIPFSALEQAVQSWVNANEANRSLKGALIWIEQKSGVR